MLKNIELLNEKDKKELESLLMVLNGIVKELEYTLTSNMKDEDKYSKFLILLKEIEDYSDKTRKLLVESFNIELINR